MGQQKKPSINDIGRKSYNIEIVLKIIVRFTCIVVITVTNTTVVSTIALIVVIEPTHQAWCGKAGEVEGPGTLRAVWIRGRRHCFQCESLS